MQQVLFGNPWQTLALLILVKKGAIIDFGAVIKAGAIIGENATISKRAIIEEKTLVGNGAYVDAWVKIGQKSVIGNEAFIEYRTHLESNSIVSPGEIINDYQNRIQTYNFNASQPIFKEKIIELRASVLESYTLMPTASMYDSYFENMGCKIVS